VIRKTSPLCKDQRRSLRVREGKITDVLIRRAVPTAFALSLLIACVAVRRALALTAAMTAGFVAVFGILGLVISPIASAVQRYLPWATVVVGCALVAGVTSFGTSSVLEGMALFIAYALGLGLLVGTAAVAVAWAKVVADRPDAALRPLRA
jgi:cytochrome c biogenesis protein CcdA